MIYVFCTQKTYKTAIYLFWALCLLVKAYKFGDCEAFFFIAIIIPHQNFFDRGRHRNR